MNIEVLRSLSLAANTALAAQIIPIGGYDGVVVQAQTNTSAAGTATIEYSFDGITFFTLLNQKPTTPALNINICFGFESAAGSLGGTFAPLSSFFLVPFVPLAVRISNDATLAVTWIWNIVGFTKANEPTV